MAEDLRTKIIAELDDSAVQTKLDALTKPIYIDLQLRLQDTDFTSGLMAQLDAVASRVQSIQQNIQSASNSGNGLTSTLNKGVGFLEKAYITSAGFSAIRSGLAQPKIIGYI